MFCLKMCISQVKMKMALFFACGEMSKEEKERKNEE